MPSEDDLDSVPPADEGLLPSIDLGRGLRPFRPPRELWFDVIRELDNDDIPGLLECEPKGTNYKPLADVKFAHHRLAQLLVQGHGAAAGIDDNRL